MYLSFAKGELRICTKATLEHLESENLKFVQERTDAGGRHLFSVAVVKKITLTFRERGREIRANPNIPSTLNFNFTFPRFDKWSTTFALYHLWSIVYLAEQSSPD